MACGECDLLMTVPETKRHGSVLRCPRCKHKITTVLKNPVDQIISLSLTSLLLLFISCSASFLSFQVQGQARSVGILDIYQVLVNSGYYLVGFCYLLFVIIIPAVFLFLALMLALPSRWRFLQKRRKKPLLTGVLLHYLKPWVMVEVFIMGVLIALIKIIDLVDLHFGFSFFSFIFFTISFTYTYSLIDTHRIWEMIREQG